MPRGDMTGPAGLGPMTGRAGGFCSGFAVPGYMNQFLGRGFGMGRRGARGCGFGMMRRRGLTAPYPVPYAPFSPATAQSEMDLLKNQAKYFSEAIEGINKRIMELEAGKQHSKPVEPEIS